MATDPELSEHVRDLFAGTSRMTTERMFSGTALYVEGDVMFAAILGGTVWMKSDATTRTAYLEAGAHPFTYMRLTGPREAPGLMSLPEAAMDDAETALYWARLSLPPARAAAEGRRREKIPQGRSQSLTPTRLPLHLGPNTRRRSGGGAAPPPSRVRRTPFFSASQPRRFWLRLPASWDGSSNEETRRRQLEDERHRGLFG